jgi:hypothetical protein
MTPTAASGAKVRISEIVLGDRFFIISCLLSEKENTREGKTRQNKKGLPHKKILKQQRKQTWTTTLLLGWFEVIFCICF